MKKSNQTRLGPATIGNSVLGFMRIKENRLKIFKRLYKFYPDQAFAIDGCYDSVPHYSDNPSKGVQICHLKYALEIEGHKATGPDLYVPYVTLEEVHKKYWSRFEKYMIGKIKKKYGLPGPFPTMNRTRAIQEFIARGFVYETDAKIDRVGKYCVKANIANLWWPEHFDSHQDAIDIQTRFGISGLTGTTLPKERKL